MLYTPYISVHCNIYYLCVCVCVLPITSVHCNILCYVCVLCVVQDSYVWDLQLVSDVRAGKAPKVL